MRSGEVAVGVVDCSDPPPGGTLGGRLRRLAAGAGAAKGVVAAAEGASLGGVAAAAGGPSSGMGRKAPSAITPSSGMPSAITCATGDGDVASRAPRPRRLGDLEVGRSTPPPLPPPLLPPLPPSPTPPPLPPSPSSIGLRAAPAPPLSLPPSATGAVALPLPGGRSAAGSAVAGASSPPPLPASSSLGSAIASTTESASGAPLSLSLMPCSNGVSAVETTRLPRSRPSICSGTFAWRSSTSIFDRSMLALPSSRPRSFGAAAAPAELSCAA